MSTGKVTSLGEHFTPSSEQVGQDHRGQPPPKYHERMGLSASPFPRGSTPLSAWSLSFSRQRRRPFLVPPPVKVTGDQPPAITGVRVPTRSSEQRHSGSNVSFLSSPTASSSPKHWKTIPKLSAKEAIHTEDDKGATLRAYDISPLDRGHNIPDMGQLHRSGRPLLSRPPLCTLFDKNHTALVSQHPGPAIVLPKYQAPTPTTMHSWPNNPRTSTSLPMLGLFAEESGRLNAMGECSTLQSVETKDILYRARVDSERWSNAVDVNDDDGAPPEREITPTDRTLTLADTGQSPTSGPTPISPCAPVTQLNDGYALSQQNRPAYVQSSLPAVLPLLDPTSLELDNCFLSSISAYQSSIIKPVSGVSIERQVSQICTQIVDVFQDLAKYKKFLSHRNEEAQRLLDFLQALLDSSLLEGRFRSIFLVALLRLSRMSELYPRCFSRTDVQCDGEHRASGGSFGEIYKGRLRTQDVGLKVIKAYRKSDQNRLYKAFLHEAVLWGQLSHINVLPFYGIHRLADTCHKIGLVSPWMKNGNINEFLVKNPDTDRRLLVLDIAAGMLYLHQNRIIHGDLKGNNILITESMRACLADFGLSSVTDAQDPASRDRSSSCPEGGTIRFQAPGLSDPIVDCPRSEASDVYAFALVCHEVFAGDCPFLDTKHNYAVMLRAGKGEPPSRPPGQVYLDRGLTDLMWKLMKDCWKHDSLDRPNAFQIVGRLPKDVDGGPRCQGGWGELSSSRFRLSDGHNQWESTTIRPCSSPSSDAPETALQQSENLDSQECPTISDVPDSLGEPSDRTIHPDNYARAPTVEPRPPAHSMWRKRGLKIAIESASSHPELGLTPEKYIQPTSESQHGDTLKLVDVIASNQAAPEASKSPQGPQTQQDSASTANFRQDRLDLESLQASPVWSPYTSDTFSPLTSELLRTPSQSSENLHSPESDRFAGIHDTLLESRSYGSDYTKSSQTLSASVVDSFIPYQVSSPAPPPSVGGNSPSVQSLGFYPDYAFPSSGSLSPVPLPLIPASQPSPVDSSMQTNHEDGGILAVSDLEFDGHLTLSAYEGSQKCPQRGVDGGGSAIYHRPFDQGPAHQTFHRPLPVHPSVESVSDEPDEHLERRIKLKAISARLDKVFRNVDEYKQLLSCRGPEAQTVLDTFQTLLDTYTAESQLRRDLIAAMRRLMTRTGFYPRSFNLVDVQSLGELPLTSGSYADIHIGRLRGEYVCLKVVRGSRTAAYERIVQTITRKAVLWGQLAHPNVLPFYGLCEFGSELSFVSPWADNGCVVDFVTNYPDANRTSLVSDTAEGLAYLHENDIIHGDLKGVNILVDAAGRAYIKDFGLSAVQDSKAHASMASRGRGVRWRAPELHTRKSIDNGSPETASSPPETHNTMASDTFAFSCVCYEIFTGRQPFYEFPREHTVTTKITAGIRPSRPVTMVNQWMQWGLNDRVWDMMNACWEYEPTKRPTMTEINLLLVKPEGHRPRTRWAASAMRFWGSAGTNPCFLALQDLEHMVSPRAQKADQLIAI